MLLETVREFLGAVFFQEWRAYSACAGLAGLQGRVFSWACPGVTREAPLATPVMASAAPCRIGREMKTCRYETGLSGLPYGNGFPNAVCHARLHESGHSRDKWSRKVCLDLSAAPGCHCLGQALQLEFGSTLWRGVSLGYPFKAPRSRPSKGNKATHEECLFNEVIFVNHSTSQTWSLLENEQFCIKWSIGVNGEGLTFSSSVSLVRWNC